MEIRDIEAFLDYYEKLRARTRRVIGCIPQEHLEWTYREGKFTLGDLVRHLATIERWLYAETVAGRPPAYQGAGSELAAGYSHPIELMDELHRQSMEIFSRLTPEDLAQKVQTPEGTPITCWKWLRAMTEHEIHHRGQIYLYLNILGVKTPPLFGLTAEELRDRSV